MKKVFTVVMIAIMMIVLFDTSSMAARRKNTSYYNVKGKKITATGTHYNSKNRLVFNKRSFYTNTKGKKVYVGGKRAYCYNSDGTLCPINADTTTSPLEYNDNSGYGCGNRKNRGNCSYYNVS